MTDSPYETGLDKNAANYTPLTPLGFLDRAARVFPDRASIVHGARRQSWRETAERCRRLASALDRRGIGSGATVATICPNVPTQYEAHFGVPIAGAVLNTNNTRLDAATIAFILEHGEAKALIVDPEFVPLAEEALKRSKARPLVIFADDPSFDGGKKIGDVAYEDLLAEGDPAYQRSGPADEWDAISLNYTSGTTGNPKGVVYHHRGAYLNALGNVMAWRMGMHPTYLWTLPMFHCNGWCFPWTLAAMAGTSICLRRVEAAAAFDAIEQHTVTHLCGAPIVMNMLIQEGAARPRNFGRTIELMTAAAPPPAAVLEKMSAMGFHITHVYGLTETYGPAVVCEWHQEWDAL